MHRKRIPTTYPEARDILKGRTHRTIANNTTLVDLGGGAIGLRLHSTVVVTFNPDGSLVLSTGGWRTVTTKDRLNRVARAHGWSIYAKARTWYVGHRDVTEFEFEDGFTIPARRPEPVTDARIEDHGSLVLVRALSSPALAWLEEHTDGQWLGNGLAVEPRYVTSLVEGLRQNGFKVGGIS